MGCRAVRVCSLVLCACAEGVATPQAPSSTADLPLGDLAPDDLKTDGDWGAALTCKPIPELAGLIAPEIRMSIDGMTLHLVDRASGFDKVFPVGVGTIDAKDTSPTFGESYSYAPIQETGWADFLIDTSSITPCAVWWTDPENVANQLPVFAGLPFIPFYGSYGIHGPISGYPAANGGSLERGYVSHGCIRMEAADVAEVFARIRNVASVPVHLQRPPERDVDGRLVDVANRWIGAECDGDADCKFTGGRCLANVMSGRGYCSRACTKYCPDRNGVPGTFCVDDPQGADAGICVDREEARNLGCRPYDHFVPRTVARRGNPAVTARVCLPGSRGWIGDHCLAALDCQEGLRCDDATAERAGICTQACDRYCPDASGAAPTFCADDPGYVDGRCLRRCSPEWNAPECAGGTRCEEHPRHGQPDVTRSVCTP